MSSFLSFAPESPDWFGRAACRKAPPDLFSPLQESGSALKAARTFCDVCPVRADCLTHALENGEEGFWGGTSTEGRKRIRRRRNRVKCPDCGAAAPHLMIDQRPDGSLDPQQVCPACGLSWRSAVLEDPVPLRAEAV